MCLQKDETEIRQRLLKAKNSQQQKHLQKLLMEVKRKQQQAGRKPEGKIVSEAIPS